MNGLNVVNAAANRPAPRPTVRTPTAYTNGIDATPATSAGNRTASGLKLDRVVNHDSTKLNGGVISAVVETVSTTPRNPCADTTQYVASSSPNRSCPATHTRNTPPTTTNPNTTHHTRRARSFTSPSAPTGKRPPVIVVGMAANSSSATRISPQPGGQQAHDAHGASTGPPAGSSWRRHRRG